MDPATLKKIGTGAAAEGAALYFGEKLKKMLRQVESVLEAAKDPEQLRDARAEWRAIRKLFREFHYDITVGEVAKKDL